MDKTDPLTWLGTNTLDTAPTADSTPTHDDPSLAEQVAALSKTVERHGVSLGNLKAAVSDLKETTRANTVEINRTLLVLKKQLGLLEQGEKITQSDIDTIKGALSQLNGLVDLNQSHIDRLATEQGTHTKQLQSLKQFRLTLTHLILLVFAGAIAGTAIYNSVQIVPYVDFYKVNHRFVPN